MSKRKEKRLKAAAEAGRGSPSGPHARARRPRRRRRARRVQRRGRRASGGSGCCRSSRQEHDSEDERRGNSALRGGRGRPRGLRGQPHAREHAVQHARRRSRSPSASRAAITWTIREQGGLGPIKDVVVGNAPHPPLPPRRHPRLAAGGVAIGTKGEELDKLPRVPVRRRRRARARRVGAAARARRRLLDRGGRAQRPDRRSPRSRCLAAMAYLIRMLRHSEEQDSETDWELAAKAWDDLQMIPGGSGGAARHRSLKERRTWQSNRWPPGRPSRWS